MEYADAIYDEAAELAFAIALRLKEEGSGDLGQTAAPAVARAYCLCVTDGEDAAEHRFSLIHRQLVESPERRLSDTAAKSEDRGWH